jgi:hypothetical protein
MAPDPARKAPKSLPAEKGPKPTLPAEHIAFLWEGEELPEELIPAVKQAITEIVMDLGLEGRLTVTDLTPSERERIDAETEIMIRSLGKGDVWH